MFPRQGETYPRMDPFPVIFALQNPNLSYTYGFDISWYLNPCDECTIQGDGFGGLGFISDDPNGTDFPVPAPIGPGPVFPYGAALDATGPGSWVLAWFFDIGWHCDDGSIIVWETLSMETIASGNITFSIADTAPTPTIAGACPALGGMVSYSGTVDFTDFQGCPITKSSPVPAEGTPCKATLDAAELSSITGSLGVTLVMPTPSSTSTSSETSSVSASSTTTSQTTSGTATSGASPTRTNAALTNQPPQLGSTWLALSIVAFYGMNVIMLR